jgi:lycopene cyclase CruP
LGQKVPEQQINHLLATIFEDMARLGDRTLKPFLQDVVQFIPLAKTLLVTSVNIRCWWRTIIPQVGIPALTAWIGHYLSLAIYSLLAPLGRG